MASLSSSLWVVKNLDQPFGRMRGRIFVVSFAVSLVVLVDGLWQAYEQQDRSILFRFAESMVESLADIRTLADGKLTTYYASEQGFAQFLSLPTDAAYSYAQMDRKLATKINMIANEIRKAEASGANVSFGTF